jgi:hypothetical protein
MEGSDQREVRMFDVQHIKGLEFEAMFFVGVDGLADRILDLFCRFVYVGMTRAATYLGITCNGTLPAALEPLRPHFGTDGWAMEQQRSEDRPDSEGRKDEKDPPRFFCAPKMAEKIEAKFVSGVSGI